LEIKKKKTKQRTTKLFFLTVRMVRNWNRLPGEVVAALCLELFMVRLDGTPGNLI